MKVEPSSLKELLIAEGSKIDEAVRRAARHALLTHKRAGNPVASWQDGRAVLVPAEKPAAEERRAGVSQES